MVHLGVSSRHCAPPQGRYDHFFPLEALVPVKYLGRLRGSLKKHCTNNEGGVGTYQFPYSHTPFMHWLPWFYKVISWPSHHHSWREKPIRLSTWRIWTQRYQHLHWVWRILLNVIIDMGGLKPFILVFSSKWCLEPESGGHFAIQKPVAAERASLPRKAFST